MTHAHDCDAASDGLRTAIHRYFDLMYDCDTARFDEVFLPSAWLHRMVKGALVTWSAAEYRQSAVSTNTSRTVAITPAGRDPAAGLGRRPPSVGEGSSANPQPCIR